MHSSKKRNYSWGTLFTLLALGGVAATYFFRSRGQDVKQQMRQAKETSTDWISDEMSGAESSGFRSEERNIPGVDPIPPRQPM